MMCTSLVRIALFRLPGQLLGHIGLSGVSDLKGLFDQTGLDTCRGISKVI